MKKTILSLVLGALLAPLIATLLFRVSTAKAEVAVTPNATASLGNCTKTIQQSDLLSGMVPTTFALPTSGVVCLGTDLVWNPNNANAAAFDVGGAGPTTVTLDLAGFTLYCQGNNTPTGIKVSSGYNVKIRNGTIEGCRIGIEITNGGGQASANVLVDHMVISIAANGILVNSNAGPVVLQNNYLQSCDTAIVSTSSEFIFIKDNIIASISSSGGYAMDLSGFSGRAIIERNEIISNTGIGGIRHSNVTTRDTEIMVRGNAVLGFPTQGAAYNVPRGGGGRVDTLVQDYKNDNW